MTANRQTDQETAGDAREGLSPVLSGSFRSITISGILYEGRFCGMFRDFVIIRTKFSPGSHWYVALNREQTKIMAEAGQIGKIKEILKNL